MKQAPATWADLIDDMPGAEGRRRRAVRDRIEGSVAHGRLVRLPQPAQQRPCVSHGADARRGALHRRARARGVREMGRAARPRLLRQKPCLAELAGKPGAALSGPRRHDADRQLHRARTSRRRCASGWISRRFPAIAACGRQASRKRRPTRFTSRRQRRNKEDARRFLAYVLRADVQERINRALLLLPLNQKAAVADDRFLRKGQALLSSAEALSQYFDRDTNEDLATIAMKGFQEFMINPDRLDSGARGHRAARGNASTRTERQALRGSR